MTESIKVIQKRILLKSHALIEVPTESDELVLYAKDEPAALLPDGIYQASYLKHEKKVFFGQMKLYVYFRIVEQGAFFGLKVYRAYNFSQPVKNASDLFKDLRLLYGATVTRKTPLPIKLFEKKVLEVKIRTVVMDRKQRPLPANFQYSVIEQIIRIIA